MAVAPGQRLLGRMKYSLDSDTPPPTSFADGEAKVNRQDKGFAQVWTVDSVMEPGKRIQTPDACVLATSSLCQNRTATRREPRAR